MLGERSEDHSLVLIVKGTLHLQETLSALTDPESFHFSPSSLIHQVTTKKAEPRGVRDDTERVTETPHSHSAPIQISNVY